MTLLAMIRLLQGRAAESETLTQEALAVFRKLPGEQHAKLARSNMLLGGAQVAQGKLVEAEARFREMLAILQQYPDIEQQAPDSAQTMLAMVLQKEGRLAEAEPLMREALAAQKTQLGNDNPMVAITMAGLANLLMAQGKWPEAETTFREVLALMKKIYGPEHPQVAMLLPNLAVILQMQGRLPEAETVLREAIALGLKVLGKDHPMIANLRAMLVQLLQQQHKNTEAEALQKEVVTVATPAPTPGTEEIAAADKKTRVAMAAMQQQKFDEAEKNLREALPVLEKSLGSSHQAVIGLRDALSYALVQQGKFAEAEAVLRDLLPIIRKDFGDKSTIVATTLLTLAISTQLQGKLVEAETVLHEALAINKQQTADGENANVAMVLLQLATVKATQGATESEIGLLRTQAIEIIRKLPASMAPTVPNRCDLMFNLLMKYDKTAQAEPIERVLVAAIRQFLGNENEPLADKLMSLNWVLQRNGKHAEAGAVAREAMEIRKKLLPRDDWRVYAAEFKVGQSLYELNQYAEAETILLEVFSGLSKHGPDERDPQYGFWKDHFGWTAGALAQVYEATKQPDKLAEWKRKHDEYTAARKAAAAAAK